MIFILYFINTLATLASGALFEPYSGIYIGAQVDTEINYTTNAPSDTPNQFNSRIGRKAAFFQFSQDFPLNFEDPLPIFHIDATFTNAFLYLTVYPTKINGIADIDIQDLVSQIAGFNKKGRMVFLRFAPEMNGSWFIYGQKPREFISMWKKVYQAINSNSISKGKTAMIWAPSVGFGYPYTGGQYSVNKTTDPNFPLLDTNRDGAFDKNDDPYASFYPGDEYVDWVGLSTYYFGPKFPWIDNALPSKDQFVNILTGANGYGGSNFYKTYSEKAGKPFFITEGGAAYHLYFLANKTAILTPGPGELPIKQAYWRQYLTNNQIQRQFPKLKAIGMFEIVKPEELTQRDFRNTFNTLSAFKSDMDANANNYIFAGDFGGQPYPASDRSNSASRLGLASKILAVGLILILYVL